VRVTASQFIRNVGRYQDEAQKEPVIVVKRDREYTVLVSAGEYRELRRRARIVQRTADMSEAEIEAIGRAEVPPGHEHLDDELS